MTPAERRALVLLLLLALAGHVVRQLAGRPNGAPGDVQLLAELTPRSPAAQRDSALALARPLEPGERIDADQASPAELARLPRVGPALAKAIVADRLQRGPFGGPAGLDRVPGVGPGLLKAVAPFLSFSGGPARSAPSLPGPSLPGPSLPGPSLPGLGGAVELPAAVTAGPVDLNAATVEELDALPGLGPARARAIVAYRQTHGRFAAVRALAEVPGLGPAAAARLEGLVSVK